MSSNVQPRTRRQEAEARSWPGSAQTRPPSVTEEGVLGTRTQCRVPAQPASWGVPSLSAPLGVPAGQPPASETRHTAGRRGLHPRVAWPQLGFPRCLKSRGFRFLGMLSPRPHACAVSPPPPGLFSPQDHRMGVG